MHTIDNIETLLAELEAHANAAVDRKCTIAAIPVYCLSQFITLLKELKAEVELTRWEAEQRSRRHSLEKPNEKTPP